MILKRRNENTKHESPYPMVLSNFDFWSISGKESLEFQEKHELNKEFLRAILSSKDTFNPRLNRKRRNSNRTSDSVWVCFTYEQLFHPVQCTAGKICQCNSIDKLALPKATGIFSTAFKFHYLWGTNCFGNGAQKFWTCLCQSRCLQIFFCHCILSFSGKRIFFGISFFNAWQLLSFNYSYCKFFGRSFWSCRNKKVKFQFWL